MRTEGDDWSGTGSDTPFVSRFSSLHLARNCLTGCFAEAAFEDMLYLFVGVVFCCFSFWLKRSGKMEGDDWPRETGFDLRHATGSYAAAAALLPAPEQQWTTVQRKKAMKAKKGKMHPPTMEQQRFTLARDPHSREHNEPSDGRPRDSVGG